MSIESYYLDELTGLCNRHFLKDRVKPVIQEHIENKKNFVVGIIDIDHFKDINDIYGHIVGDRVIADFADFLKRSLRSNDYVIRFGGDEFICVMLDTTKSDAEVINKRITNMCRKCKFADIGITLSIGIAAFPDDGSSFEDLFRKADLALYDAKRSGRDRVGVVGERHIELPIREFIDRRKEKEELRTMIEQNNCVRIANIRGVVGVGKTRLCKEVIGGIKGKEVIWADCAYFDEPIAYYAIRDLIRYRLKRHGIGFFTNIPAVYRREIGILIPELFPENDRQIITREDSDRYRLYESIRKTIEIGECEKIIVIDNVQWIDIESLEVMKYLLRAFRDTSITFVFSQRTEEKSELFESFLANTSREYFLREIKLEPFEVGNIREVCRTALGLEPPSELVDYVMKESGGIPYYIEEILRILAEKRNLYFERGGWQFVEPTGVLLPRNLTDITVKKYRSLSREAQYILEIASTIGWFDLDIFMQLTEFNVHSLQGLMEEICLQGIAKYTQDRYVFSAAVNRKVIYDNFVKGFKAKALHQSIAAIFESKCQNRPNVFVEELAYHYYFARDQVKGVDYCIAAGDNARAKYAHSSAIRYYSYAIDLLSGKDDVQSIEQLVECQLKKASVLSYIGSNVEAMNLIEEIEKLDTVCNNPVLAAEILVKKAGIFLEMAQFEQAISNASRAKDIYRQIGVKKEEANALVLIGRAHTHKGDYDAAMEYMKAGLEIFDEVGDEDLKARTLLNIGLIHSDKGDYALALRCNEECINIYRLQGNRDGEARILVNTGSVYQKLGKLDEALEYFRRATEIFQEIGSRINEARALNNTALILGSIGKPDEALQLYMKALSIHQDVGNREGEALVQLNIGNIEWYLNEPDYALASFHNGLNISKEINSNVIRAYSLLNLVDIYLSREQYDKVEMALEEVSTLVQSSKLLQAYSLYSRCEYYLKTKQLAKINEVLEGLSRLKNEINIPKVDAMRLELLGRYYLETGAYDSAFTYLNLALKIYDSIKEFQLATACYLYLSKVEYARHNFDKATQYLLQAEESFKKIKCKRWLEIINQYKTYIKNQM